MPVTQVQPTELGESYFSLPHPPLPPLQGHLSVEALREVKKQLQVEGRIEGQNCSTIVQQRTTGRSNGEAVKLSPQQPSPLHIINSFSIVILQRGFIIILHFILHFKCPQGISPDLISIFLGERGRGRHRNLMKRGCRNII